MAKIHEYRIVEFEDGYDKRWFRPQRKGLFFWHYARQRRTPFSDGDIVEFETLEEAKQYIGDAVNEEKKAMRDHVMTHIMIPKLAEVIALKIMQDERDKKEEEDRKPEQADGAEDITGDPEEL